MEGYKVLPPCVLYAKIGAGGMGAVYRGRHLNLDIDVAIKCLKPSLALDDQQFVQRFLREGRSAAQLNHQNIIRVYDVAEECGLHYIIMELVQGETARERLGRKRRLGIDEAIEVVYGAALGLAEAHRVGIIHRDIKPDNILISVGGRVKLADLGLAKPTMRRDENSMLSLATGMPMGTPQYMPPEQWLDTSGVGPQADVWALGATLFFLLAGREGIPGDSIPRIMTKIINEPFPDIRKIRPDVPEEVAALLAQTTATEISDRPADAGQLVELIEALSTRRARLRDEDTGSFTIRKSLVSPPPGNILKKIRLLLTE